MSRTPKLPATWRSWLAVLVLVAGGTCLAQGCFIYVKALVAQVMLRSAWHQALQGAEKARPWPWADTWPVARLLSPRHEVDLVILEGASGSSTAFGPGRIQTPALFEGGGSLAIAGHRDTHFAFLEQVEVGDEFWVETPGRAPQRYTVQSMQVVHESQSSMLNASDERLTLVTCYPFHAALPGGPLRYVVTAQPSA